MDDGVLPTVNVRAEDAPGSADIPPVLPAGWNPAPPQTLELGLREITLRLLDAADAVREALEEYREANSAWVEAERDYRHARAVGGARLKSKLAKDREDELFIMVENEWLAAEMAKVLRDSAKEALRACEAILSGIQSVAGAHRAETQLAKWGPEERSA